MHGIAEEEGGGAEDVGELRLAKRGGGRAVEKWVVGDVYLDVEGERINERRNG